MHAAKGKSRASLELAVVATSETVVSNAKTVASHYAKAFHQHRLDELLAKVYPPSRLGEHIYISDKPKARPDVGWRSHAKQATKECTLAENTWRDPAELCYANGVMTECVGELISGDKANDQSNEIKSYLLHVPDSHVLISGKCVSDSFTMKGHECKPNKHNIWNKFGVGCIANHKARGCNMQMRWFHVKNSRIGNTEKPTYMRRMYLVATCDIGTNDELTYNYGNNCKYMLKL